MTIIKSIHVLLVARNVKLLKLQQFFLLEYILFEQLNMIAYDALAFELKTCTIHHMTIIITCAGLKHEKRGKRGHGKTNANKVGHIKFYYYWCYH